MTDGSVGPDHLVHKDGVLLLGVGNPLLDISCKVPMDVLEKYGVKSGDIILAEDRHATLYDELVAQYAPEYIAGGATQNSIRVAQWMSQKAGATAYFGCIGKDDSGEQLKAACSAAGVNGQFLEDAVRSTAPCLARGRLSPRVPRPEHGAARRRRRRASARRW